MRKSGGISLLAIVGLTVLVLSAANAEKYGIPPPIVDLDQSLRTFEFPNARINPRVDTVLDYRLPNNTVPVHYDVELTTTVNTGATAFSGTVKIDITVAEDTRTIVIHARQLRNFIATISRTDITTTSQNVALEVSYEETREFLSLTPADATISFAKDSTWTLTITYEGDLRSDNGGFYLSTYTDANGATRYLATTQFESTDARHAFPCYDEPAKRATFTITINHDSSYTALSNMPVDETNSRTGTTVFQRTVIMPTYLVAFIVSDFVSTEGVMNSLPQRIFSRPSVKDNQELALVAGMLIIERLNEYYGVQFPLPKLDQVAVPDFSAGAMENWGLVTYREEYLLYNKDTSTTSTQTNVVNTIAHEYTHQWFGNLVAIKWWTYLWLKEGFATLYSYQATDEAYPEWGVYQIFHTSDYQRALVSDASTSSVPMTHYVQTPNEIRSRYDIISYQKGGSVLHMWQNALTDTVFRRGLHNYLENNKYSAAEEWELFDAIQTAAKEEGYAITAGTVRNMMSSWTQQSGYPLLTVVRNYNTKTFTVTQEAFFNDETVTTKKSWYVPFNYVVGSNPDFRNTEATHYLANVDKIDITDTISNDDWLILNKQSTGYYRINYDEQNWALIADGLIKNTFKIHPRNRAQLMHDAYRFSISNRLEQSVLLNLMKYLTNEDQYAPWTTANSILTTYDFYLRGDEDYADFQAFVAELVSNIYEKLGVNDVSGEQHNTKFIRNAAINLACLAGIESCLQETNNKLNGLITNNIAIEPNLQSQIYCNGLKQSADTQFDFIYNKLQNSAEQAERTVLISALGCSLSETQLAKFVAGSIDTTNSLRTQERTTLLSSAYSRSAIGLTVSIDFLHENWEAYADLTPGFSGSNPLDSAIRGMSSYVTTTTQQANLLALVQKVKDSEKVTATLETSVQANMQSNFNWLDKNRTPLMSWFKANRGNGSTALTASLVTIFSALLALMLRQF